MNAPTPRAVDGEDLTRARAFIAQVEARFRYANTVPEHPHEYLVRAWLTPELQADFEEFCQLIARHGYRGVYWHQTWVYLDVDQWRYWESKSWFGERGNPESGSQPARRLTRRTVSLSVVATRCG